MTRAEKFVKLHFPSARCVAVNNTYRGKTTRWYIIYFDYGTQIDNLGASQKNEILAWRNSVYWAKQVMGQKLLKKLES